ncbi:hypothetical protein BZJ19_01945 [Salinivibrio proteolyticus]|nr:hypothetical protein BZJ19_01945 [Salinivibrio proteolyticus]
MCLVVALRGLALVAIVLIRTSRSFRYLVTLRVIWSGDCEPARPIEDGWVSFVTDEKDIIKKRDA